jgi:YidC/Oxa1 family membrane protein insertase
MTNAATMDKNQRYIMLAMPVVFVVFVIRFPAGVLVYWITTNAWTMAQQYIIKRRLGPAPPAAAVVAAEGGPSDGRSSNGRGGGSGPVDRTGPSGGLGGLIRGRAGRGESAATSTATVDRPAETRAAPPPPPRKKKKQRSGRRR